MNNSNFFKLLMLTWIVCFAWMIPSSSANSPVQKILILNASHKGDDMSDSILDGIESVLPRHAQTELYIEYMDIKRHSINDSFVILRELYVRRYGNTKIDAIMACDDLALQFVMENRNSLFPEVPVVFCGVENLDVNMPDGITGIRESEDLEETIKLAHKLHPNRQEIVVISDQTPVGKARLERFQTIVSQRNLKLNLTTIVPNTINDLINDTKKISENCIVFFLHFSQDTKQNQYTPAKIINSFQPFLKAPLYTAWYYPRASGILGGKMVNGLMQGKLAAMMVDQILAGKPIDSIPILQKSPNSYIFNYQEMKRFHVHLSDLPGGSVITHKPGTFFYKYRHLIGSIALVFACMLGVVLILMANIIRRKNAERSLEQQIRVLNSFMETIPNPVFFKDDHYRFQQCNVAFQALIGMDEQEIIGKTFADITTPELAESFQEREQMLMEEPGFQSFETKFQRSNGEVFTVIINHATITDEHGKPSGLIGSIQDITDIRDS
ncbi:MAG: PAS/PAC sensor signal transduction histidine kinase [Candidatus Magnetoglobus multicellularis str. Araruama]|uniref:PAS/PAC sensor signal transduction histidine kinase n=1 Tax=Candidatus Magnetoglobus multicellularis str. Araruama TaxID=890399 RepID=A0A1V1PC61_9BACT|nr:MAG: PAS/PAC sensor signal transduction histidine kinase [Candidatus Magnetoglobus multicellularis str. Araruama]